MGSGQSKVHDQLWIANITATREEAIPDSVDRVVGVCQDSVEDNVGVPYTHFNLADGPFGVVGGRGEFTNRLFFEAAQFILDALTRGETVLVHCHAGQSRSASTSIAALAAYEGVSWYEMEEQVAKARPQIHPDPALEKLGIWFTEVHVPDVSHKPFSE